MTPTPETLDLRAAGLEHEYETYYQAGMTLAARGALERARNLRALAKEMRVSARNDNQKVN